MLVELLTESAYPSVSIADGTQGCRLLHFRYVLGAFTLFKLLFDSNFLLLTETTTAAASTATTAGFGHFQYGITDTSYLKKVRGVQTYFSSFL